MKIKLLLLLIISLLLCNRLLHACGCCYCYEEYILGGRESSVLTLPYANFYQELAKLVQYNEPVIPKEGWRYYHLSHPTQIKRDVTDLELALDDKNLSEEEIENILWDYRELRQKIKLYYDGTEDILVFSLQRGIVKDFYDLSEYTELLKQLPEEFRLYLYGAIYYKANNFEQSIIYWAKLLELPEEQRLYRSTWASFMLGKAYLFIDMHRAIEYFEMTREMTSDIFCDSLNLSLNSISWQALAEERLGMRKEAILHYFEAYKYSAEHGYSPNGTSLRFVCRRLFSEQEEISEDIIRDPICRRVVSAWILAGNTIYYREKWLKALQECIMEIPENEAEMWAKATYQVGEFEEAKYWLSLNEYHTPNGNWLKSKILLRDGKIDEAIKLLESISKVLPVDQIYTGRRFFYYNSDNIYYGIHEDLGALYMGRKEYLLALDSFTRAGRAQDAAYLVERVLSREEVDKYLESRKDDWYMNGDLGGYTRNGVYTKVTRLTELRFVFFKRMVREKEWDTARKYCPPYWKYTFDRYARHMTEGMDSSNPPRTRAENLFEAAKVARWFGYAIMAAELDPDFMHNYYWDMEAISKRLENKIWNPENLPLELLQHLTASEDEKQRVLSTTPAINKKRHYRYYASELMWQAAELLPDNDRLTALALYYGGTYIKDRAPQMADKFYKALVNRCGNMPIGQEADKLRWFPKEHNLN